MVPAFKQTLHLCGVIEDPLMPLQKGLSTYTSIVQNTNLRPQLNYMTNILFTALLPLQTYVKESQSNDPRVHVLHDRMMKMTKEFLSSFIKPEVRILSAGGLEFFKDNLLKSGSGYLFCCFSFYKEIH